MVCETFIARGMIETLHFAQMLVGIIAENCLHVIPAESVAALRIFIAAYVFQGAPVAPHV